MKILIISSIPAIPSWGTAMIYYRHFCERKDFTISVITDDTLINNYEVPYSYQLIDKGKFWTRISRTRFYKIPHTVEKLGRLGIPVKVMKHAKEFNPDAVLTMAGSWTWMAILAEKVARKLNVPLIGCFYDWWYYNIIYHPKAEKLLEKKFRQFYKNCDLAICISEGMQKELGEHKNSIVLYPMGIEIKEHINQLPQQTNEVFTVAFAGNVGEWYGKMIESLITAARGLDIRFKIFGNNPSWSKEFDVYVKKEHIYRGHISHDRLKEEIKRVDGLLLLMGFDASCAVIETTSFKSKFMDYLYYQKPVMLWGPSYSTAVITAKKCSSAAICTSPAATDFIDTVVAVKNSREVQEKLCSNAYKMYEQEFNPEKIHTLLKAKIKALVSF